MSVITPNRTLDLKPNDSSTRNKWVQYFYDRVLKHKLEEQHERRSLNLIMSHNSTIANVVRSADSEALRKLTISQRYAAYKRACNENES